MTTNQENIVSDLVSTVSPTVPIYTAFEKPIYEVPKHKYASQIYVWVMKLKATITVQPDRRKNNEPVLITKMRNICYLQQRQCMCNVTLRRVHATVVAVQKQ
jgi:hypothetical protein